MDHTTIIEQAKQFLTQRFQVLPNDIILKTPAVNCKEDIKSRSFLRVLRSKLKVKRFTEVDINKMMAMVQMVFSHVS